MEEDGVLVQDVEDEEITSHPLPMTNVGVSGKVKHYGKTIASILSQIDQGYQMLRGKTILSLIGTVIICRKQS